MPPIKAVLRGISPRTAAAFFVTLFLCLSMAMIVVVNRSQVGRLTLEQLVSAKGARLSETASRLLFRAHVLAYHIIVNEGELGDFHKLASILRDHPAVISLLVAPDGVVSAVYPLYGNEAVLGLDFFAPGAGNREARAAKEKRELVLGGPFEAVQGVDIVAGRLAVFFDADGADAYGGETFWGIVSVALNYESLLYAAGLGDLAILGFDHEIRRPDPYGGPLQLISGGGHGRPPGTRYVEKSVEILNSTWYFRALPLRRWHEFPETWLSVTLAVIVSLMVAALVQGNVSLSVVKTRLGALSNTDPLTGISNRRHFMELVGREMDRAARLASRSYVMILDLDNFKAVNDTHGHPAGDAVLKEVAARVISTLRPYDLFARYGGEEFILFVADMDESAVLRLAERVRLGIADRPVAAAGQGIAVTCCLGIAPAAPENDLDAAVALADAALYKAKRDGRNRIEFARGEGQGES